MLTRTMHGSSRWLRRLAPAAALLILAAACGDDDAGTTSTDGSSTTASGDDAGWCDVYDELQSSEDFGAVDAAGAPEEIREPLQELATAADELDPNDVPDGALTRLFEANAAVETWGYDHCGGDHPFCSVWITVQQSVAVSALSDGGDGTAYLERLVDELEPVLTEHVPPELSDALATALDYMHAPTDEGERAAAAANDALDEWTRTEGCAGAPPEKDDENAAP